MFWEISKIPVAGKMWCSKKEKFQLLAKRGVLRNNPFLLK